MVPHCFILGFKLFSLCFKKRECEELLQHAAKHNECEFMISRDVRIKSAECETFGYRKDPLSLVLWNPIPVHPRWLTLPSGQFCQPHQYTGSIWEKETFPHREAYLSLLRTGRIWCILVLGEFLYAFDFIVSITPSKWPLVTWTTRVTQASLCFHYLLQQVMS